MNCFNEKRIRLFSRHLRGGEPPHNVRHDPSFLMRKAGAFPLLVTLKTGYFSFKPVSRWGSDINLGKHAARPLGEWLRHLSNLLASVQGGKRSETQPTERKTSIERPQHFSDKQNQSSHSTHRKPPGASSTHPRWSILGTTIAMCWVNIPIFLRHGIINFAEWEWQKYMKVVGIRRFQNDGSSRAEGSGTTVIVSPRPTTLCTPLACKDVGSRAKVVDSASC